jgi:hypothetical protein
VNPRGPHWDDQADLIAWLLQLRDVVLDLTEAAEDATRDEPERQLGRPVARETILAARRMANDMIDLALKSLSGGDGGAFGPGEGRVTLN